jgi:hypothetical protein
MTSSISLCRVVATSNFVASLATGSLSKVSDLSHIIRPLDQAIRLSTANSMQQLTVTRSVSPFAELERSSQCSQNPLTPILNHLNPFHNFTTFPETSIIIFYETSSLVISSCKVWYLPMRAAHPQMFRSPSSCIYFHFPLK